MMRQLMLLAAVLLCLGAGAQPIQVKTARFHTGDDLGWKEVSFDDSSWQTLRLDKNWTEQGVENSRNYAWYRIKVVIPKSLMAASDAKESLRLCLGPIDDSDETYLNGVRVGMTGRLPDHQEGYSTAYDSERIYDIPLKTGLVRWDEENVIAIRVYSGDEPGGMECPAVEVFVPNKIDYSTIALTDNSSTGEDLCTAILRNDGTKAMRGVLSLTMTDFETGEAIASSERKLTIKGGAEVSASLPVDLAAHTKVKALWTETSTGRSIEDFLVPKYILTPEAPAWPRYNGPLVYGVRPGSPVIFKIPVSGDLPMEYSAKGLPQGLSISKTGVLSGSIQKEGDYKMTFIVKNDKGTCEQEFTLKVGRKIALTPPMGWNSWNCWGLSVSQEKVISSAHAIIEKRLADYGYSYINIDDAWEAEERNPDGTIAVNEKFPDMKGLGDWLHASGLKFGIYSSPGDLTCGGHLGSLGHEEQDAKSWNSWGIDYLKYDWCGYGKEFDKSDDKSVAAYVRPYLKMEQYLREQPRDIFYSLCQYGMADVWKWGHAVDANSWRTTGDINDSWESLYEIGFELQTDLHPYAGPGNWNDPDMLVVGKVGWGPSLRDSRLTADEQYTHISLWCLLASNMLIGCDVSQIDDFTLNLLCNNEVNAINQDILGKQASRDLVDGPVQIWRRPLADGSFAIGIFNLGEEDTLVDFATYFDPLGIDSLTSVRDLWRQKDLDLSKLSFLIPTHGVRFLRVRCGQ